MANNFPSDLAVGVAEWLGMNSIKDYATGKLLPANSFRRVTIIITNPSISPATPGVQYYILKLDIAHDVNHHEMSSTAESFVNDILKKTEGYLMALEKPALKAWLQSLMRK